MTARAPRFELVRRDAGWFWRFIASNGKTLCHSETYKQKRSALNALDSLARSFSSTDQVWIDEGPWTPDSRACVAIGSEDRRHFGVAHRVTLRVVDERGQ